MEPNKTGRRERTEGRPLFHKNRATQTPRYKVLPPRGEGADLAYLDTDDTIYYWDVTAEAWVPLAVGNAYSEYHASGSNLTLEVADADVPDCEVTLPVVGDYIISAVFHIRYISFPATGTVGVSGRGKLANASDNLEAGVAEFLIPQQSAFAPAPGPGQEVTVSQQWKITTTTANEVYKLRADKSASTAGVVIQLRSTNTTIIAHSVTVAVGAGGSGHTEDHDHDGSPTQKLLAANSHESPASDTHHPKIHTIGGVEHTGNLAHADLSDAPTDAHHAKIHVLNGGDHTGPISAAQHPSIVTGDLHPEYFNATRHIAIGDALPHHVPTNASDGIHTVSIGGQILQGVGAGAAQQGHVKLANHFGGTANLPEVDNHNIIASGGLHSEYALAANTHGTPSTDTHHSEDHDHGGSPTQKLLEANTHESVSSDTHHPKVHNRAGHSGVQEIRVLVFTFPDEDLAAAVYIPRPSWILLDNHPAPTSENDQRFTATCDTVGAGTNTVVLESTTTSPFTGSPSWTVRATLALGTSKRVSTTEFVSDWVWDPTTEYLRVRCSAVNATAPKEALAYFEWE